MNTTMSEHEKEYRNPIKGRFIPLSLYPFIEKKQSMT